jgi:hypothetical protein
MITVVCPYKKYAVNKATKEDISIKCYWKETDRTTKKKVVEPGT